METLNGTTIFWLVTLGLTVGFTVKLIMGDEGINMPTNLIFGVIGSTLIGSVSMIMGVSGSLLFALLATLAVLFVVNVFHQHHAEDVFGHSDEGIKIVRKKKS